MKLSRGYRGAFVLLTAALFMASCGSTGVRAPVASPGEAKPWRVPKATTRGARLTHHVVRKGETLYTIAWQHGVDYRTLAAWNQIGPPYTIFPGQKLTVAPAGLPAKRRTQAGKPSAVTAAAKNTRTPAEKKSGKRKVEGGRTVQRAAGGDRAPDGWHWPAKGELVTTFIDSGRKGVNIAGRLGDPIYAAANGRVVYTGGGLRGYGELIIVKHNHRYLSAYAHNNKLLVREGDTVTGGQRIAEMGRTGTDRVMLHFEIRRDGKPVDPIAFLPKQ